LDSYPGDRAAAGVRILKPAVAGVGAKRGVDDERFDWYPKANIDIVGA
jgi:hypothetical protein